MAIVSTTQYTVTVRECRLDPATRGHITGPVIYKSYDPPIPMEQWCRAARG